MRAAEVDRRRRIAILSVIALSTIRRASGTEREEILLVISRPCLSRSSSAEQKIPNQYAYDYKDDAYDYGKGFL